MIQILAASKHPIMDRARRTTSSSGSFAAGSKVSEIARHLDPTGSLSGRGRHVSAGLSQKMCPIPPHTIKCRYVLQEHENDTMLSKVRSTNSVDPFRVLQQACEVIHLLSGERAIGPVHQRQQNTLPELLVALPGAMGNTS